MSSTLSTHSRTRVVPARPAGTGTGHAHAKAILLGEHAVVYGAPAVALPVHGLGVDAQVQAAANGIEIVSDLFSGDSAAAPTRLQPVITAVRAALDHHRLTAGARVAIRSEIPHERGLGSSAAVAAAVARAVADLASADLGAEELQDIVQQAERVAHGNPSGLDARGVTSGTPIRFHRGEVTPVRVGGPLALTLADSGSSGSTARAVAGVRALRDSDPAGVAAILSELTELTESAAADLTGGDTAALGTRMTAAHQLLGRLGVSDDRLDHLVRAALAAGAAGAKLTGGGQGGCILALATSVEHAERLAAALHAAGAPRTWTTTVVAA